MDMDIKELKLEVNQVLGRLTGLPKNHELFNHKMVKGKIDSGFGFDPCYITVSEDGDVKNIEVDYRQRDYDFFFKKELEFFKIETPLQKELLIKVKDYLNDGLDDY